MTGFPPALSGPPTQDPRPPYLAVQLPGSVVLLSTASVENGLIVHFDQLPFRAVAEVPKHPADDTDTHNNSNADSYNHG